MIFKLASKYLFSKNLPTGIHLISITAIISIAVGTAILIIVLSVFNGLEKLIYEIFGNFDPEYKIVYKSKYIPESKLKEIKKYNIFPVIRNKAVLKNKNYQRIVEVVALDRRILKYINTKKITINGLFYLASRENVAYSVIGSGVAYDLQLNPLLKDTLYLITIDEKKHLEKNPYGAINYSTLLPMGIFSIQNQYDNNIIFVDLKFARRIFNLKTATELFAYNIPLDTLKKIFPGNNYNILNRNEQHKDLYKVLRNEKLIAFLMLTFVLMLISFNILTTISIISISKQRDITILYVLGTPVSKIKKIFTTIGIFFGAISLTIGIPLAIFFIFLQHQYGIITLGETSSFVVKTMPMELKLQDIAIVILTVMLISTISSVIPAYNIKIKTSAIR